jgi:predicted DNA-binding transcriptional regulator AlpA
VRVRILFSVPVTIRPVLVGAGSISYACASERLLYLYGGKVNETHEYLTESQVSQLYQVSCRTLQRWRSTGEGPPWIRIGTRGIRYDRHVCDTWATDRTFVHRADELAKAKLD